MYSFNLFFQLFVMIGFKILFFIFLLKYTILLNKNIIFLNQYYLEATEFFGIILFNI